MSFILSLFCLFTSAGAAELKAYAFHLTPFPESGEREDLIRRLRALQDTGRAANFNHDQQRGVISIDLEEIDSEFFEMSPAVELIREMDRPATCAGPLSER